MSSRTSHTERTASQPRQNALHSVRLAHVQPVNSRVRLLKLALPYAISFLPGQWLDVHIPSLPKAGGFTITSTPARAEHAGDAHLELAIQHSPANPPASWLWRPTAEILDSELRVRVGGSFVYPPAGVDPSNIKRLVFIAGGVGINPLMSMMSHLHETRSFPNTVRLLYATKVFRAGAHEALEPILFHDRLRAIFQEEPSIRTFGAQDAIDKRMTMFDTSSGPEGRIERPGLDRSGDQTRETRVASRIGRIKDNDLEEALGDVRDRQGALVYVCGPATMTDEVVAKVKGLEGVDESKVLCEKWW